MQLEDIKKVSVIGAGIMGHGIGFTFALNGYKVTLQDVNEKILSKAMNNVKMASKIFVDGGLISPGMVEPTLSRIATTTDLEKAVKDADFITEAVVENAEVKTKVFHDLDVLCSKHAILASNTSALLPKEFDSQCSRKDKLLVTHWFNPPHIVPAIEVLGGEGTSEETLEVTCALLKKVKKIPVVLKKPLPGFLSTRLYLAMLRELWSLWEQGVASAEDLDLIVKGSFGFRLAAIGPMEQADLSGLDTQYTVGKNMFRVISSAQEPPEKLKKMVEAGQLGSKTGKGFFNYPGERADERIRLRNEKFVQLLKLLYY